jgi:ribosomal protein S18 acetylase RimI-like enzyme
MSRARIASQVKIVEGTRLNEYEKYLYKCLAPMPFRRYSRRRDYLEKATPKGFHKKFLLLGGTVVATIEYAPAKVSGYPISGDGIIVMNCVWVLRKAKGQNFGRLLVEEMIKSEKDAAGFATIALEKHWSGWFRKNQIEKLGFRPLDSIKVEHKTKHRGQAFSIYLMWMPILKNAKPPTLGKQKLLEGETFCLAHPLYRPQAWKGNVFETK